MPQPPDPEHVTVASDARDIDQWLVENIVNPACKLVGLDCEWDPHSRPSTGVHLIQLAVPCTTEGADKGLMVLLAQVCISADAFVCMCVYVYACKCMCMYAYLLMHLCVCVCMCVHVYACKCMCMYANVCVCMHIC